MIRSTLAALAAASALVITACGSPAETAASAPTTEASSTETGSTEASSTETGSATALDALTALGYDATDVPALIDALDATPVDQRPDGLIASVRPDVVKVSTADGAETDLPIPADRFYLSFAPYLSQTHDCHFHSLTTCRGELANTEIDVTVTNDATGETIIDGPRTTFDNGFAGLWLPRGITGTITVSHDGRTASAPIDTGADDAATCLTTLPLV